MKVLLGSGGFRTDDRKATLVAEMQSHFGEIDSILFVPYALADHDGYVAAANERGLHAGYTLQGIHQTSDPVAAVRSAQGIYVGGGNTFRLIKQLHELGLIEAIRTRILADGVPYLGVSAGTNVACPTMRTTNDMPIVQPPSFDALGLVPFQVNAHYHPGGIHYEQTVPCIHTLVKPETTAFVNSTENTTPVVGLFEGGLLRCREHSVELTGSEARVFRPGDPTTHQSGEDLMSLLELKAINLPDEIPGRSIPAACVDRIHRVASGDEERPVRGSPKIKHWMGLRASQCDRPLLPRD